MKKYREWSMRARVRGRVEMGGGETTVNWTSDGRKKSRTCIEASLTPDFRRKATMCLSAPVDY